MIPCCLLINVTPLCCASLRFGVLYCALQAVNAYYGCYLYSEASGKSQYHSRVMQLLLAMEVQATGVYWHMKDDSVYEQLFSKNRMAGMHLRLFYLSCGLWVCNSCYCYCM